MIKDELLARIARDRALLTDAIARLDDEAILAPSRNDGWTAKDILAHLTAWEQRLLRWIERWRATGDPGRPEVAVTGERMDQINDEDYLAAREKPIVDVRRESSDSYDAIMRAVDGMGDDELAQCPESADGPSWFWIIGASTYEHYEEHREEMEAWQNER